MPTVEDHLKEIVGGVVAQLMIQTALLRAEIDATREKVKQLEGNGMPADGRPPAGVDVGR